MKKILLATLSINLALAASAEARKGHRSWAEDSVVVGDRFLRLKNKTEALNQKKYISIQGKETPFLNPVSSLKRAKYKLKFERDVRKVTAKTMNETYSDYAVKIMNLTNASLYKKPKNHIN